MDEKCRVGKEGKGKEGGTAYIFSYPMLLMHQVLLLLLLVSSALSLSSSSLPSSLPHSLPSIHSIPHSSLHRRSPDFDDDDDDESLLLQDDDDDDDFDHDEEDEDEEEDDDDGEEEVQDDQEHHDDPASSCAHECSPMQDLLSSCSTENIPSSQSLVPASLARVRDCVCIDPQLLHSCSACLDGSLQPPPQELAFEAFCAQADDSPLDNLVRLNLDAAARANTPGSSGSVDSVRQAIEDADRANRDAVQREKEAARKDKMNNAVGAIFFNPLFFSLIVFFV